MMHLLHLVIILTSVFGFLMTDLLAYYIIFQTLILCSWIGYGFYDKRWGRCVITEIQWDMKETHDVRPETESYIHYWLKYKLGLDPNEKTVDKYVTIIFAVTFIAGIARITGLLP